MFLPGGIASSAISYSNRAQMATAIEGIFNSQLQFFQNATTPPTGSPGAGGAQAIGQIFVLPIVYNGFDGWETGIQMTNQQIGGSNSFSHRGVQRERAADRDDPGPHR